MRCALDMWYDDNKVLQKILAELKALRKGFFKPHYLFITGVDMADATVGKSLNFTVVGKNAAGTVVPVTGITVTVDANGTATVNDDGTGGVFTGTAVGTATLMVTNGTLTATATVNVTEDVVLASLEIVFS